MRNRGAWALVAIGALIVAGCVAVLAIAGGRDPVEARVSAVEARLGEERDEPDETGRE